MFAQEILGLSQTFEKRANSHPNHCVLGDASGVVVDPDLPLTNVFVRTQTSNGLSSARSVKLDASTNIVLQTGVAVLTKYDHNFQEYVSGYDTEMQASGGVSSSSTVQKADNPSTSQGNLATLQLTATGTSMLVSLKGWNPIINGVYYEFSFPDINLGNYLPSSGEQQYATICVLEDMSDVEVITSTPTPVSDLPLGADDVNECLAAKTPGSTATWAVPVTGDMTTISQDYIDSNAKDLRQLVNNAVTDNNATLTTTNNTTTTIASIVVAELSAITITGEYTAAINDYTAAAGGTFRYTVRRASGGNVTQVAAATISQDEDSGAGSPALSLDVDTGTQTARIRVTGVTAENWSWRVRYAVTKVS